MRSSRLLIVFLFACASLAGCDGCRTLPETCDISWQPNALAPVFYGVRDYGAAEGAPGPVRVFFPSLDGAVWSAPVLEGCGTFPVILFAHGHCAEVDHFQDWYQLPAQLARSGYVVLVPDLPATRQGTHPWSEDHPDLDRIDAILEWVRTGWEHADVVMPAESTAFVGHSYGALLAARYAAGHPAAAYASLSGVWSEWPGTPARPVDTLAVPKLFTWGTGLFDFSAAMGTAWWNRLPAPRHLLVADDAGHWDALPAGVSGCETDRGSCSKTSWVINDVVTLFFAEHLPPSHSGSLPSRVPDSLVPPEPTLSEEQQFFAGGHLIGVDQAAGDDACSFDLSWATTGGSGTMAIP